MAKQRNTQQRQIIESILRETDHPLLPKELLEIAHQSLPSLGIATVFRALKDLVKEGVAHPVHICCEPTRYEGARDHHHHFKCLDCGTVFDLHSCTGNLESMLPSNFQLLAHDITLFGKCADCTSH